MKEVINFNSMERDNLMQTLLIADLFSRCSNFKEASDASLSYAQFIEGQAVPASNLFLDTMGEFIKVTNIFFQFQRGYPGYQPKNFKSNNKLLENFNNERQLIYVNRYINGVLLENLLTSNWRIQVLQDFELDLSNIIYTAIPELFDEDQEYLDDFNKILNMFSQSFREYLKIMLFEFEKFLTDYKSYLLLWLKKSQLIFMLYPFISGKSSTLEFFNSGHYSKIIQAIDFRDHDTAIVTQIIDLLTNSSLIIASASPLANKINELINKLAPHLCDAEHEPVLSLSVGGMLK